MKEELLNSGDLSRKLQDYSLDDLDCMTLSKRSTDNSVLQSLILDNGHFPNNTNLTK